MSIMAIDMNARFARPIDTTDVVGGLRAKLEEHHRRRARRAGWSRRFVPTGLTRLDTVLPHGGLPCGAVTEIISDGPGAGSMSLAMRIAGRCNRVICGCSVNTTAHRGTARAPDAIGTSSARGSESVVLGTRSIVLVDVAEDFYPPAACQHGIALDRLIVIRTRSEKEAFWAVDQSLRCAAIAVVIAPLKHLDERLSRRLQLAAESAGCLGLILRLGGSLGSPLVSRRTKSFAAVQMLVEGVHSDPIRAADGIVASGASAGRGRSKTPRLTTSATGGGRYKETTGGGRYEETTGYRRDKETTGSGRYEETGEGGRYKETSDCRLCRITLLKVREGMPVEPLLVDLHDETGALPLHPLPVERSAAKRA